MAEKRRKRSCSLWTVSRTRSCLLYTSGKAFKHTSVAPDPAVVRAWARSNQYEVPPRGRIPKRIYEAYNAAH